LQNIPGYGSVVQNLLRKGFFILTSNLRMAKDVLRINGEVVEALPNTQFRVELVSGQTILSDLSGKMRLHRIRVVPGDWVTVELSPYNLERGRIATRLSQDEARSLATERDARAREAAAKLVE
jgi:translation initiation factor IF-1